MNNLLRPFGKSIVSSSARTATGNSGTLVLPLGESYLFILDCTASSGTAPTLDVAYQITVDATTYYSVARHAQLVTTGTRYLRIQPTQGRGEAGVEALSANTGGALANNVILTRNYRVIWTIGGTNPSFTFSVLMFVIPKQSGTY